jgi:hypothetical protein
MENSKNYRDDRFELFYFYRECILLFYFEIYTQVHQ